MKKASRQSAARTDEGKEMTTVRLPMPVKCALRRLAEKENRTISNYLSIVLTNHVREAGELPQEV